MKKNYFTIVIIIVALVALSVTSCRNKTQTNIVGTWKYIPHTKPDSTTRIWNFYAGNELEITTITPSDSVIRTYTYDASKRDLSIYGNDSLFDVNFYIPGPTEYRGKYYIHHLGKDILKIEKVEHGGTGDYGNPYLMVELVKQ